MASKTDTSNKSVRPRLDVDLAKVEQYAALGLSQEQIAQCLGISPRLLYYKKKQSAEFAEAIKRGKAKGIAVVTSKLMEQVKAGNVTAMIFFLKSQAGWKEAKSVELTGKDGAPIEMRSEVVELTQSQKAVLDKVLDEEY